MNYYNEYDPKAAAWLRELIAAKLIPAGEVDEHSITDVKPTDLSRFVQCHFFAGIGGWSQALALAGWPEDRPVWTGSCPCQPYSCAGKQEGQDDPRNLWPAFFRLIRECRSDCVFGEQVEGAIGHGWLDGVQRDMEGEGYAVGHCVLGAHSVGAPHIRQRLYWVGISPLGGLGADGSAPGQPGHAEQRGEDCRMADAQLHGSLDLWQSGGTQNEGWVQQPEGCCTPGGLGDTSIPRCEGKQPEFQQSSEAEGRLPARSSDPSRLVQSDSAGSQSGRNATAPAGHGDSTESTSRSFWSDFNLIPCADGKSRRVESGVKPLVARLPRGVVHGGYPGLPFDPQATAEARVMRLRGYGNAICPELAAEFIKAISSPERPQDSAAEKLP